MNKLSKERLYRAAEAMELPSEVLGAPQIEITDGRRILLGGHKGIRVYTDREIIVDLRTCAVRVQGEALRIVSMTRSELLLGGTLERVEFLR